jgi:hypothetical protein
VRALLDEMHSPSLAIVLRERSIDAVAVAELPSLRGASDEEVLAWSCSEGRVVVTENVGDFSVISSRWAQQRREHAGLVHTHPRRFHRGSSAYPFDVADALEALASTGWPTGHSEVRWL